MRKTRIRIATRKSPLALWQAEYVRQALQRHYSDIEVELIGVVTTADRLLDTTLNKIGGKGLFVKELETALLEQQADIAVHSLKDMPADTPAGLMLTTFCEREEPRDVLISPQFNSLADLPTGACIGTSSLRRQCQLLALRPDLHCKPLRGNVNTRLTKLAAGDYTAIVLAAAGLQRLDKAQVISQFFSTQEMLPAVGQGVICIECRVEDEALRERLTILDHLPTRYCITAERAMNHRLQGNCQVPIAGYAVLENETVQLRGLVGTPNGEQILHSEATAHYTEAEKLGQSLAEQLLAQGAAKILAAAWA